MQDKYTFYRLLKHDIVKCIQCAQVNYIRANTQWLNLKALICEGQIWFDSSTSNLTATCIHNTAFAEREQIVVFEPFVGIRLISHLAPRNSTSKLKTQNPKVGSPSRQQAVPGGRGLHHNCRMWWAFCQVSSTFRGTALVDFWTTDILTNKYLWSSISYVYYLICIHMPFW